MLKSMCCVLVGSVLVSAADAGLVEVNVLTQTECGTRLEYDNGNGFSDHTDSDGLFLELSELTGFDHFSHPSVASVQQRKTQSAKAWADLFLLTGTDEISYSSEHQGVVQLGTDGDRSTARYESGVDIEIVFDTDTTIEVFLSVSTGTHPLGAFAAELALAGVEGVHSNRVEIDSTTGGSDQSQTLKVRGTVLAGNSFTIQGSSFLEMDSMVYGEGTLVGAMLAEIRILPAPGTLALIGGLGLLGCRRRR